MKITGWVLVLFSSSLLLLVALTPLYTSIKPVEWVVAVSIYYMASIIYLLIKTWYSRITGIYVAAYIWVGAMVFGAIQGIAEGKVANGWLAGCLGGALVGGIAGYVINSISNKLENKNVV